MAQKLETSSSLTLPPAYSCTTYRGSQGPCSFTSEMLLLSLISVIRTHRNSRQVKGTHETGDCWVNERVTKRSQQSTEHPLHQQGIFDFITVNTPVPRCSSCYLVFFSPSFSSFLLLSSASQIFLHLQPTIPPTTTCSFFYQSFGPSPPLNLDSKCSLQVLSP